MGNTMTTAPTGFKPDADASGTLHWGDKIETERYFLSLAWTAEDGLTIHSEVDGNLTAEEALQLGTDLAHLAGRMKDVS
jgi:hypothetical protein